MNPNFCMGWFDYSVLEAYAQKEKEEYIRAIKEKASDKDFLTLLLIETPVETLLPVLGKIARGYKIELEPVDLEDFEYDF